MTNLGKKTNVIDTEFDSNFFFVFRIALFEYFFI